MMNKDQTSAPGSGSFKCLACGYSWASTWTTSGADCDCPNCESANIQLQTEQNADVSDVAANMNENYLDYAPHPGRPGFVLVAHVGGIFSMPEDQANDSPAGHERVADSWIDAQSDELPPPPSVIYLDVTTLDALPPPLESDDDENARALAAEWSRHK